MLRAFVVIPPRFVSGEPIRNRPGRDPAQPLGGAAVLGRDRQVGIDAEARINAKLRCLGKKSVQAPIEILVTVLGVDDIAGPAP